MRSESVTKADILSACPDISTTTVERVLHDLLVVGKIEKTGAGRSTGYVWKRRRSLARRRSPNRGGAAFSGPCAAHNRLVGMAIAGGCPFAVCGKRGGQMDSTICDDVREATKGKVYGYARVSTRDQNLDRQLQALAAFPVEGRRVFADKASGKDFDRPAHRRLMARLRPGDVLVVKEHRQAGARLQRDPGAMARDHQAQGRARGGARHAASGHAHDAERHHGRVPGGCGAAASQVTSPRSSATTPTNVRQRGSPRPRRGECVSAGLLSNGPRSTAGCERRSSKERSRVAARLASWV